LVRVVAGGGEGEKNRESVPRVEEVASCDLFYPWLMIYNPFGVL
jgi:hypothetical protein